LESRRFAWSKSGILIICVAILYVLISILLDVMQYRLSAVQYLGVFALMTVPMAVMLIRKDMKYQDLLENKQSDIFLAMRELDLTRQKIEYLANHDEFTGLPNRRAFMKQLENALARAKADQSNLALVYLDLDKFQSFNDMLGHLLTDQILQLMSRRFAAAQMRAARVGGDEFTIILENCRNDKSLHSSLNRLMHIFSEPFQVEGYDFYVSASMGVSLYPDHASDPDTLLNYAELAMRQAKQNKNTYQIYRKLEKPLDLDHLKLQRDLRLALQNKEFVLHYQSKHDLQTLRIIGSEALIRWQHPTLGLVPPNRFIPLAEEMGLMVPIGNWLINQVCGQIRKWSDMGLRHRVSINLSAVQFQSERIVHDVRNALEQTGIDPSLLELEITESMAMNIDEAMHTLIQLNNLGVRLSIDDFGTGYSSLNYLNRLPIHQLKIDRSFIQDINLKPENEAIVSAIVSLAENFHLRVVAEGVETEEQLRILKKYRCHEVQGFLFQKPLPLEEFEKRLFPVSRS